MSDEFVPPAGFEEHKMRNEFQEKGYEDWLTSNEGISDQSTRSVKSMADMREAFYEEKRRAKEIIKYNGIEDVVDALPFASVKANGGKGQDGQDAAPCSSSTEASASTSNAD